MAYKDILVHLDDSMQWEVRLNLSVRLAADQGAHLLGLFTMTDLYIPPFNDFGQLPPDYFTAQEDSMKANAEKVERSFADKATSAGIANEWRVFRGVPIDAIRARAQYGDLLILGQRAAKGRDGFGNLPADAILSVGRPVLVIPHDWKAQTLGERVMVGWDGSAQAARAVHDSLPLMLRSGPVEFVAVDAEKEDGRVPVSDMIRHLARHGVEATAEKISTGDGSIGEILLTQAAARKADLLVMGAYGHSRWREVILGGVTKHMLEHMNLPVLMAH